MVHLVGVHLPQPLEERIIGKRMEINPDLSIKEEYDDDDRGSNRKCPVQEEWIKIIVREARRQKIRKETERQNSTSLVFFYTESNRIVADTATLPKKIGIGKGTNEERNPRKGNGRHIQSIDGSIEWDDAGRKRLRSNGYCRVMTHLSRILQINLKHSAGARVFMTQTLSK